MPRRERIGDSLHAARAALAALGPRGKTTPIPPSVRARVLAYTQRQRAVGASWQTVARAIGVSASALKNWSRVSPPARRLVPVVVSPAGTESSPPGLAIVSPAGYRVEGLDLATATALLRALA